MTWYRITCRCTHCGTRWARRTKNPDSRDPPCPNLACGENVVPIGMDLSSNKAPAAIGGNIHNKAIDETAKMVMEDYGITDMRDDVRRGETASPKLPPQQQALADNFFGGPKGGRRSMPGFNPARHAAAAVSGQLVDPASTQRSIGSVHANRVRPPVHIINRPG